MNRLAVIRSELPLFLGLLALTTSSSASSQAWQCRAPAKLSRPAPELPPPGEYARRTPVKGYTLALSWSREYCKGRESEPKMRLQCSGAIGDFGFVLHGLWPETNGPNYPQWCRKSPLLSPKVIAQNICMTPDVQLLQHEWVKHGTCMARSPEAYFGAAKLMFEAVQYPDMDRLSRKPLTAAGLADAIADINEGLPANAVRVKANERGWLQEVRICLGKDMRPRRCPNGAPGVSGKETVKIWRGG